MKHIRIIIQFIFLGAFLFLVIQGKTFIWLAVFGIALLGTIFFGRFYCGYICPMNTAMKLPVFLAERLHLRTINVPRILRSRWLPWLVFAMSALTMIGSRKVLHKEIPILIILLVFSLLVTLRYEPWVFHNHICPFGALLSIPAKFSLRSFDVEQSKCIGCKKCEKVCDAQAIEVDPSTRKATINKSLCHQCHECASVCPVKTIKY